MTKHSTHPGLLDVQENRRMLEHVRPHNWEQPAQGDYDFIAIGGGTGGLASAGGAALLGARTALVERDVLGGDCLVSGCIPSKALIHAARVAHDARHGSALGVNASPEIDFCTVMRGVRERRANVAPHDSAQAFRDRGVDVLYGEAKFIDAKTLEVGGRRIRFRRAVIATGSRPVIPPIPGLAEVNPLTNETIFELTEQPRRLLVFGGGPIGSEMAQAFARLGTTVTLVEGADRLLQNDIPEAGKLLAEQFRAEGIDLHLNTLLEKVEPTENGGTGLLSSGETVPFDRVLVAAGRSPVTDTLALENAGITCDSDKGITTDQRMRTANKRIYAVGDCASALKFTHAAYAQAEYAVFNALYGARLDFSKRPFPWCTYTDPEVAHVGSPLRNNGEACETIRMEVASNDRALAEGDTTGFAIIRHKKGKILNATVTARDAGNLIPEITALMVSGKGLGALAKVIHAYPTRSELLRHAADQFAFSRVTPIVRKLTGLWCRFLP